MTIIEIRGYSMEITEKVQNQHLEIEEATKWVRKNIIETATVIRVLHYENNELTNTIENKDYSNPEDMCFRMNVKQFKTNKK